MAADRRIGLADSEPMSMPESPLVGSSEDHTDILRPALFAVAAGLIAAAVTTSPSYGAHPWSPVRHPGRQQTVSPVREQRPIHYPRAARSLPAELDGVKADPAIGLLRDFFELHTAMAYEQAAVVAAELIEISPDAARAHYNHACVMGRLRRSDEALSSLERAVDYGWRNLVHLSIDPDLDSLRTMARYRVLVQRLKKLLLAESPALPEPWPARVTDLNEKVPALLARSDVPEATRVTMAIVDDGAVVWSGSFQRTVPTGPTLLLATNPQRPVPAETDLADLARLLEELCAATMAVDSPERLAAGYLQLTEPVPGGVVLLRWSPERRRGVVVVTSGPDRGPIAGQIARLALGHPANRRAESQ